MLAPSRNLFHVGRFNSALPSFQYYSTATKDKTGPEVPVNVPEPRVSSKPLAQFKRGPGEDLGRASFSGNVVTIFGATGFLGSAVVNRLAKHGNQLIIPYRCDPYHIRELKVVGDLGQILFFPFNLKDEESIRKAVKYSNVVINLVGSQMDTGQFSQFETNEHGARRIARISKEMGVERLIHISAMNADPAYKPVFYKKAKFLQSKGLGEIAVREEFPSATIIRPSVIYGTDDHFISRLLTRFRKSPLDTVYVWGSGEYTYKMPINLGDVSLGIAKSVVDPTSEGKTFEFVGPHCYKYSELVDFLFRKAHVINEAGFRYTRHGYFDPWFRTLLLGCTIWNKITHRRLFLEREWIEFVECSSDVLTGAPTLADLGIQRLTEFEYPAGELRRNFPEPPLPLRSPVLYKNKSGMDTSAIKTDRKSLDISMPSYAKA
ncbi:NAD dependent epimerase/dehydratase family domain-containing protein [Ditylenchus destructor]|nr:NAD dependent epimerase/dehydratase family domain-containing protein [Ditylenchus destructor]